MSETLVAKLNELDAELVRFYGKVADRIAELEAENTRLMSVMSDVGHLAGSLGSGSTGWLRGRFMSISNALNAAIGRTQSSHGDQFDAAGNVVKPNQLNSQP